MKFRPPHSRLMHGINTELKNSFFCSLKNAHRCIHAVEWRTCTDSSDNVTLLEQTSLWVTYFMTSLICLTRIVAIDMRHMVNDVSTPSGISSNDLMVILDTVFCFGWFTDDSCKVRFAQTHRTIRAGWFAQQGMIRAILWMFHTSKLLCCVSFKLGFNYFIYLIYQLLVWALLVADVNLGYMHLSTKYYTL